MIQKSNTLFKRFNNLEVLIIGDVMIDRYLNGKVTRISPEAPVPIIHLNQREDRLGGAGNVALNIDAMGAKSHLISVIGKDANAALFLKLLPEQNLIDKNIIQSSSRITTVKTRVLAANQQMIRIDEEATDDINNDCYQLLINQIKECLDQNAIDVILLQDYNKGILTDQLIREISLESIRRDIPIVVDPKVKNFFSFKQCTLFKPNLKEIRTGLNEAIPTTLPALLKASKKLRNKLSHQYTMITLSEKGIFVDDGKEGIIIPTHPRKIADVCGAGDTVVSIAALGIALKLDIQEIATLSNLAGGQVCEQVGVVPIHKKQLQKEYEDLLNYSTPTKL